MFEQPSILNHSEKAGTHTLFGLLMSMPAKAAQALLRIYQWILSPLKSFFFGASCGCRFQPTCSCYAYDAFGHFGFRKGLWFTVRRLLRCHPWHPGGYDPLPDANSQKK